MIHGFDTEDSPVPDYLVCEVSKREWSRRLKELPMLKYLTWKLFNLENAIRRSVEHGIIAMSADEMSQLSYRLKAISLTRRIISQARNALDE